MSYSLYCLMECVILLLNQICIFVENNNIINMCSTNVVAMIIQGNVPKSVVMALR